MKLYSYYRSSAAYRVRIALNLKGIDYQQETVNLLTGEEQSAEYQKINPQKLVPVLEHDGRTLFQSMAILEYLEEIHPEVPILPTIPAERARVRALANIIACEIHPLNNLRILNYLVDELNTSEEHKLTWYRHWIESGFEAFETYIQDDSEGRFCVGEKPGMADILLIPQVYNARRFNVDMQVFPLISSIEQHCLTLAPFQDAIPENQPDAK